MNSTLNITVVVACREGDDARELRRCLNSIAFQTMPHLAVYVIDLGGADGKAREISAWYGATFEGLGVSCVTPDSSSGEKADESAALAAAVRELESEYVIVMSASSWLHESLFELVDEAAADFADGFDVAVMPIALVLDGRDEPMVYKCPNEVEKPADILSYRVANPFWGKVWKRSCLLAWLDACPCTLDLYTTAPALISNLNSLVYVKNGEPLVLNAMKCPESKIAGNAETLDRLRASELRLPDLWNRTGDEDLEEGLWKCLFMRAVSIMDASTSYTADIKLVQALWKRYTEDTHRDHVPDLAGAVRARIEEALAVGEPLIPRRIITYSSDEGKSALLRESIAGNAGFELEFVDLGQAGGAHASESSMLAAVLREVYENGGVYLQEGSLVRSSIDELFYHRSFCVHDEDGSVSEVAFGAEPQHPLVKAALDIVEELGSGSEAHEAVTNVFVARFGMSLGNTSETISHDTLLYESWRFRYPSTGSFMYQGQIRNGREFVTLPVESFQDLLDNQEDLAARVKHLQHIVNTNKAEVSDLREEYRSRMKKMSNTKAKRVKRKLRKIARRARKLGK